jgi:hypothetical protein
MPQIVGADGEVEDLAGVSFWFCLSSFWVHGGRFLLFWLDL